MRSRTNLLCLVSWPWGNEYNYHNGLQFNFLMRIIGKTLLNQFVMLTFTTNLLFAGFGHQGVWGGLVTFFKTNADLIPGSHLPLQNHRFSIYPHDHPLDVKIYTILHYSSIRSSSHSHCSLQQHSQPGVSFEEILHTSGKIWTKASKICCPCPTNSLQTTLLCQ